MQIKRSYTMNEVAKFTGLTTRTLRNYMKLGLLSGEKEGGIWRFCEENIDAFMSDPFVKQSIETKQNGIIYDVLANDKPKVPENCFILNAKLSEDNTERVLGYFLEQVNQASSEQVQFRFSYEKGYVRIILSGIETEVAKIVQGYYEIR